MYIRRKQLTKGKVFILVAASIFAIISVGFVRETVLPTSAKPHQPEPVIVIDPGHGGVDGGAVGVNGEVEKDINLSIALKLRSMLELSGFETKMTRDEDVSIHDSKFQKISDQKTSDIKNRLKMIENNEDGITVSIHQNHFTEGKYSGAQMFYGKLNPQSPIIAQFIQESFVEQLQPDNQRLIKEGTNTIYLLKKATVPIVLVECGFLSNASEAAQLTDEEYQTQVAFAVYSGIMEYYAAPDQVRESKIKK